MELLEKLEEWILEKIEEEEVAKEGYYSNCYIAEHNHYIETYKSVLEKLRELKGEE